MGKVQIPEIHCYIRERSTKESASTHREVRVHIGGMLYIVPSGRECTSCVNAAPFNLQADREDSGLHEVLPCAVVEELRNTVKPLRLLSDVFRQAGCSVLEVQCGNNAHGVSIHIWGAAWGQFSREGGQCCWSTYSGTTPSSAYNYIPYHVARRHILEVGGEHWWATIEWWVWGCLLGHTIPRPPAPTVGTAAGVLARILSEIPANGREWLDPALEREAYDIVNRCKAAKVIDDER